jgi:hypothetical protein
MEERRQVGCGVSFPNWIRGSGAPTGKDFGVVYFACKKGRHWSLVELFVNLLLISYTKNQPPSIL